jgi:hypothetical protein
MLKKDQMKTGFLDCVKIKYIVIKYVTTKEIIKAIEIYFRSPEDWLQRSKGDA